MTVIHLTHGEPPFAARDISAHYDHPAFDVVFCAPLSWRCHYLEEPFCSTLAEAQELADRYNKNGWPADLPLVSLEHDSPTQA